MNLRIVLLINSKMKFLKHEILDCVSLVILRMRGLSYVIIQISIANSCRNPLQTFPNTSYWALQAVIVIHGFDYPTILKWKKTRITRYKFCIYG